MKSEKLLTVKDVAELLRASDGHVRRLIVRQRIPEPVRPGGRAVRWRPEDIRQWIEAGCPDCREVATR